MKELINKIKGKTRVAVSLITAMIIDVISLGLNSLIMVNAANIGTIPNNDTNDYFTDEDELIVVHDEDWNIELINSNLEWRCFGPAQYDNGYTNVAYSMRAKDGNTEGGNWLNVAILSATYRSCS